MTFCDDAICQITQVNLINNYSFESHSQCPFGLSQMNFVTSWYTVSQTPDYYNSCGSTSLSVPKNFAGTQNAATGNAYVGLWAHGAVINPLQGNVLTNYREYIGTQLMQPLVIGKRYYLSMKVSLAEWWSWIGDGIILWKVLNTQTAVNYPAFLPCNKLGMKFTTQMNSSTNQFLLMNNFAHLYTQNVISDTTNWTVIQGSFIADSSYSYLSIGNFFDANHTDTLLGRPFPNLTGTTNGNSSQYALTSYYYVDDVIVSLDSTIIDQTLSVQNNQITNHSFLLFPNPAKNLLTFHSTNSGNFLLRFFDITGIELKRTVVNKDTQIDIEDLKKGMYYVIIAERESILFRTKVLKE